MRMNDTPANLVDGILKERDRLIALRTDLGEQWDTPSFTFYRHEAQNLINRATTAIGGGLDVVQMIRLYKEMKDFE